jgi:hypothetical protein
MTAAVGTTAPRDDMCSVPATRTMGSSRRRWTPQHAWRTLTSQEKRRLLHGLLDRVVVSRARGRGKKANPVSERTQIVLGGKVLLRESPDDEAPPR